MFVPFWFLVACAGPKIQAPNAVFCTASGHLFVGLDCAETNTGRISALSYLETIDFLEPQHERECVPVPGFNVCADNQDQGLKVKLPARAGAVMESDADFTAQKNAFEKACVELGNRCTPEMRAPFELPYEIVHKLLFNAYKKKALQISPQGPLKLILP